MDGGIGRATNKLTDRKVLSFKRGESNIGKKLADGGGMYLTLTPAGTAAWRIKYRIGGKEKLYAIGTYPEITLEAARAARDQVKALLREGRDPVQARALSRTEAVTASSNIFKALAHEWLAKKKLEWSNVHYLKSSQALDNHVLEEIGDLPVRDITAAMVARIIERLAKRSRDLAAKVRWQCLDIFRMAQARGLCALNPAEPALSILPKKKRVNHLPAVLDFAGLGGILRDADDAGLTKPVRMAHRLCAFTVARISNIVQAEWREFHLDAEVPTWVIPRAKMKAQDRPHDHKIVLCPKIVDELRAWRDVVGSKGYLFPSRTGGKHVTREALEKAYRVTLKLDGRHSPHGWRSSFSTLAKDNGFERDAVELALDHIHDNGVVRAYDRGERLKERIRLATWWGEQLTKAQRGGEVVKLRKPVAA